MPGGGRTDSVMQNIRSGSKFAGPKHRIHNYTPRPHTKESPHGCTVGKRGRLAADDMEDFTDPFGTRPANKRYQPMESTTSSSTSRPPTRIGTQSLSKEQEDVVDLVLRKSRNVFFTGSAGKS